MDKLEDKETHLIIDDIALVFCCFLKFEEKSLLLKTSHSLNWTVLETHYLRISCHSSRRSFASCQGRKTILNSIHLQPLSSLNQDEKISSELKSGTYILGLINDYCIVEDHAWDSKSSQLPMTREAMDPSEKPNTFIFLRQYTF